MPEAKHYKLITRASVFEPLCSQLVRQEELRELDLVHIFAVFREECFVLQKLAMILWSVDIVSLENLWVNFLNDCSACGHLFLIEVYTIFFFAKMLILNLSLQIEHMSFFLNIIHNLILRLVDHVSNLRTHKFINSTKRTPETSLFFVFYRLLMEQIVLMFSYLFIDLYKISEQRQSLSSLFLSVNFGLI